MKKVALFICCFAAILAGVSYAIYNHQQSLSKVLLDPVYVDATISKIDKSTELKKRASSLYTVS